MNTSIEHVYLELGDVLFIPTAPDDAYLHGRDHFYLPPAVEPYRELYFMLPHSHPAYYAAMVEKMATLSLRRLGNDSK